MIYATITVVAGAMAFWLHTKWGKKFLRESLMVDIAAEYFMP